MTYFLLGVMVGVFASVIVFLLLALIEAINKSNKYQNNNYQRTTPPQNRTFTPFNKTGTP